MNEMNYEKQGTESFHSRFSVLHSTAFVNPLHERKTIDPS
jgi:hypothetical protein